MTGPMTPDEAAVAAVNPREPWQLLDPTGQLRSGYEPTLGDAQLLDVLRRMLLSRHVDERGVSLQRQGRLGTFSTINGQEASVLGSAFALEPGTDWLVPQYRELPAMLFHGYPLEQFFRYFRGDPMGNRMADDVKILPFQISLAAQIPHAVGLAWGTAHQGQRSVVTVYFGDGASSEGDAHEAMNLAGVRRAPVIFFVQNNGWAISTPVSKQTAAPDFATRGPAYGFPGVLVDGNDFFAVYEASRWAADRARRGDGPTVIEARTYRLGAHNTADDPTRYVPADELEARRALDPVVRFQAHLESRGLVDDGVLQGLQERIAAEVSEAIDAAEAAVPPGAAGIFDEVYANEPPRLARQRQEAARWQ